MFSYSSNPIIIKLDDFYYCLFTNIILVFDKNGIYTTVLDPSAFRISVKRMRAEYIWHENIDSDSKSIKFKQSRNYGSYDVDGFEYGIITICIANQHVTFTVSSSSALDKCEAIGPKYKRKLNQMHDPIPNYLSLLSVVTANDSTSKYILERYVCLSKYRNYFCKEISL